MATTIALYNHVSELHAKADVDGDTMSLKLALVNSSYTFSAEHTVWADVSANEITGTNYTAGGKALTGVAVSRSTTITKVDADDVTWTTLTATFRRGILYASGTYGAKTNPVLASVLYDDTAGGTDVTVTAVDFVTQWNANGIYKFTVS